MSWLMSNDGIARPEGRRDRLDGRAEPAGAGVGLAGRRWRRRPRARPTRSPPPHAATKRAIGIRRAPARPAARACHQGGSPKRAGQDRRPRPMMRTRPTEAQPRRSASAGCPRSNQIRSPVNRCVTGSHGNRIRTSSETASPDGATPAHGPRLVPVNVATSNAPCGPMTISDSAKALSGNAANSSA